MIFKETNRIHPVALEQATEEQVYKDMVTRLVRRMPLSILKRIFQYTIREARESMNVEISVVYDSDPVRDECLIPPEDRENLQMLVNKYVRMNLHDLFKSL
jgi:hypothetical protein